MIGEHCLIVVVKHKLMIGEHCLVAMVKNMQMIGKHCLIGSSGNEYADDWRTVFGKEYADVLGALFDR